jgi:hypothetical protein
MSIPNVGWNFFWNWQLVRLEFRALLLWRALVAATFWTVVFGILARFVTGEFLAIMITIGVWGFFAWPTIASHLIVFADLVNYLVTGKAYLMRAFAQMRAERSQSHEEWLEELKDEAPLTYVYARVAMMASYTSPLGPLAMWCALLLKRLPDNAYQTDNPAAVLRIPKRAADIEGLIVEGLVHSGARRGGGR